MAKRTYKASEYPETYSRNYDGFWSRDTGYKPYPTGIVAPVKEKPLTPVEEEKEDGSVWRNTPGQGLVQVKGPTPRPVNRGERAPGCFMWLNYLLGFLIIVAVFMVLYSLLVVKISGVCYDYGWLFCLLSGMGGS
jgi:hypothetical protein